MLAKLFVINVALSMCYLVLVDDGSKKLVVIFKESIIGALIATALMGLFIFN